VGAQFWIGGASEAIASIITLGRSGSPTSNLFAGCVHYTLKRSRRLLTGIFDRRFQPLSQLYPNNVGRYCIVTQSFGLIYKFKIFKWTSDLRNCFPLDEEWMCAFRFKPPETLVIYDERSVS
jgi:hypothetical protein